MPASVRTLSQLPELSSSAEIMDRSLFEVSNPAGVAIVGNTRAYKYVSRKVAASTLSKKFVEDMRSDLISNNGLVEGVRIDELCSTVKKAIDGPEQVVLNGEKKFTSNPIIDNSPLSSYTNLDPSLDGYSVNFGTLKKYSNTNSAPLINPGFGFVTTLNGDNGSKRNLNIFKIVKEGEVNKAAAVPNFIFDQNAKNIVQTEFVFKVKSGETKSNVWEAPASGIFTCYGWLDEINNPSPSNETRWVALMGKEELLGAWTILQVQPFIKNNYLSYVGFTFPVRKGMKLQIVTGFPVGSNSDKYFAANGSLTNHEANSFLGGVYTGLSADSGSDAGMDFSDVAKDFAALSDLNAVSSLLSTHERDCDLSTNSRITNLSAAVSADPGNIRTLSAIKMEYIDFAPFVGNRNVENGVDLRRAYIKLYGLAGGVNNSKAYQSTFDPDKSGGPGFNDKYIAKQIRWEDYTPSVLGFSVNPRRYYGIDYNREPMTQQIGTIQGYVEKAYTRSSPLKGGAIFTDGDYMYYKVSQNSMVRITLIPDFTDGGRTAVACYVLYDLNRAYTNIKAASLLFAAENAPAVHDIHKTITIPAQEGTVFLFAAYQGCTFKSKDIDNSKYYKHDAMLGEAYWNLRSSIQIPKIPQYDAATLTDLIANASRENGHGVVMNSDASWGYSESPPPAGESYNMTRVPTYLLKANASNYDKIFRADSDGHLPTSSAPYSSGSTIAQIIEFP